MDCLKSPSVNSAIDFSDLSSAFTFSFVTNDLRYETTSFSSILINLKTAHLLCIGAIIFEMLFAIKINLQYFAVSSIILLSAVCASDVISSASSKIIILNGISVSSPANLENFFTLSRTMFIPRSSDALSSKT